MDGNSKRYFNLMPLAGGVTLAVLGFSHAMAAMPEQMAARTTASVQVEKRYAFAINEGELASVLNALGQQAGILISYDQALLQDKQSSGLNGSYSLPEALRQILEVHGLGVKQYGPVSYAIIGADQADQPLTLPLVRVTGREESPDIKQLKQIDMRDSARSDFAELLSMVPSVRVDDTASSSLRQGDLKPAEFSIRGAAPYQNKLMLDGSSIDSMLDPMQKERQDSYTSVAGHSQGLFVDPGFVKEVKVIDVNAPAREGNFIGGVVKAETQSYDGRDRFEISHRMTKGSWTEFHVDDSQLGEFEDGAAQLPVGVPGEFQPDFEKSETTLSGATRAGDLGLFFGLSEKRAQITQKQAVVIDMDHFLETGRIFKPGEEKALDRNSRYAVMRMDLLERDYDFNASLAYSDYKEDSFLINYRNSDYKSQHNGLNLSLNFGQNLGETRMDLNFSLGTSSDERNFEQNVIDQYKYTSIYGAQGINGGFGQLANTQRTLGSTLDFITPLSEQVKLNYGGEFKWSYYKQDRGNDFTFNEYTLDFSQPLPPQTSPGSWAPDAQYHSREAIYGKGVIDFTNLNSAAYAELEGEQGHFFWRTGARLERDSWLGNTNLAPRLLAGLYLDEAHDYRVTLGANRYYGKSFLSYRLREKERSLLTIRERTGSTGAWVNIDPNSQWEYRDLETPYDDEYSLGLYGPVMAGQAGLQLVTRKGRDQIRTHYDPERKMSWFANDGASDTHQVDLFWRSEPLSFMGANWTLNSSLAWMDKNTDSRYASGTGGYLSSNDAEEEIIYEGQRMARYEMPATDFATPITANVDLITQTLNDRLFVRNSVALSDGYRYLKSLGNDSATGLKAYSIEEQGATARWDLSVEYQLLASPSSPYLRADVINVLNSGNAISGESGVQLFGVGRQFWLELGYRF